MSRVTVRQENAEYKPFGTLPKGALFMHAGSLYQKVDVFPTADNALLIGDDIYEIFNATIVVQHVDVEIIIRPAK